MPAGDQILYSTHCLPQVVITVAVSVIAVESNNSIFIWLPAVLVDRGFTPGAAGSMLALYAIIGLPTSLTVPLLVAKMQRPLPIGAFFTLMFAIGYGGLLR